MAIFIHFYPFHPLLSIFSTFIHFIHFHPLQRLIQDGELSSKHFHSLLSTLSTFIQFHPLLSSFIQFHPLQRLIQDGELSSKQLAILIHPYPFHPLSSTVIHFIHFYPFYPLSPTSKVDARWGAQLQAVGHFHPLLSTFIHFHPFYPLSSTSRLIQDGELSSKQLAILHQAEEELSQISNFSRLLPTQNNSDR